MKAWILSIALIALGCAFSNTIHSEENPSMKNQRPTIVIETTQGNIEIQLFSDIAPKTVENFLTHAKDHYYDGTIFHRVIPNFMIQGGDPLGTGTGGESIWGKSFADEFNPSVKFDKKGVLAMANRGPNTNGSQFFITTAPTPWLNNKHTIFGEVTKGYDVVQKIETTKTGAQDRPLEQQKIIKITVKQ
jgi:peptidylprolyl isomerase